MMSRTNNSYTSALLAGAVAGFSVDVTLFPVDTVKTRLQSSKGFWNVGGFRSIYSGLPSTLAGSMPSAALFFCTYELVKKTALTSSLPSSLMPFVHMVGASAGEVMACFARVPTEVIKQRAQASIHLTTKQVFMDTLSIEGLSGFYRGFFSTVIREVPFSFMQFPLWEFFKAKWAEYEQKDQVDPWQSGVAGALAGGLAAGITTPLDVAKTRIMLAKPGTVEAGGNIFTNMKIVYSQRGVPGLFAGVVPRVLWISIGGAIFLGVYDKVKVLLYHQTQSQE